MSRFLARKKVQHDEPYVRPSLSLQLTRTESIASDATTPNNSGSGRTIGLLFDYVGGKIERYLNEKAGQRRLGPQAIIEDARKLKDLREERRLALWQATGIQTHLAPTDQEYIVLKKRCRKLLKYCRSHVLATQLDALEGVTTLAVEDPYARHMLAGILHHSYLIPPRYKELEVYSRSYKALISVKESEIYDFFFDTRRKTYTTPGGIRKDEYDRLVKRLEYLLRDIDVSFLLGRLMFSRGSFAFSETYFRVASTNPHVIEWETLRGAICRVSWFHTQRYVPVLLLARHFPILQRYSTGLYSDRTCYNLKDGSVDFAMISKDSSSIIGLLGYLCGSQDLECQLLYFGQLDEETSSLFQGTVFADVILIAYAYIYVHAQAWHHPDSRLTPNLLADLRRVATVFFNYSTCGNSTQRILAREAIVRSLAFTRYFKSAISQYDVIFQTEPNICPTLDASITHWFIIQRKNFLRNTLCQMPVDDEETDDVLLFPSDYLCWLEVDGDRNAFDATGHFPVLAGFDASGNELYVVASSAYPFRWFSYVPDGARVVSMVDAVGEARHFSQFEVLVLMHDPCDVRNRDIPEGAKFQTGYVYWIRDEEDLYKEDSLRRYVSESSWVKCDTFRGPGEIIEPDERGNEDNALEGKAELSSSETFEESTSAASRAIESLSSQTVADADARLARDFVLDDGENQKDMSERPDHVIEELRRVETEAQELHRASTHQPAIDEKKRQITAKIQVLADQMRELEEERRELEIEKLWTAPQRKE